MFLNLFKLNSLLAVVGIPLISTFTPRQSFLKRYKYVIQSPSNDDVVINTDKECDHQHGVTET